MSERDILEEFQDYFPDAEWHKLFTTAHLDHFAPGRGETGDPIPCLEVHLWDQGKRSVAVMMLAVDGWNDADTRRKVMRGIGREWAKEGWKVLAVLLASAAWSRKFTDEEYAARQGRAVSEYDDRREIMMVAGMTLDSRTAVASAEILRDKTGRVRAVHPWEVLSNQGEAQTRFTSYLLEAAWEGYATEILRGGRTP